MHRFALLFALCAACDPRAVIDVLEPAPGGGGGGGAAQRCPDGTERIGPFTITNDTGAPQDGARARFAFTGGGLEGVDVTSAPEGVRITEASARLNYVDLRFRPPVPPGGSVTLYVCSALPGVELVDVTWTRSDDERSSLVDPWHDVAGFLNGQTLYVARADAEAVLQRLQAFPVGEGQWAVEAPEGLRAFGLEFTANVAEAADQPVPVEVGPDRVVYRNAECAPVVAAPFESRCEALPGGQSRHRAWDAWSACRAGRGYCVGTRAVVGHTVTFDLAACEGPAVDRAPLTTLVCF